MGEYRNDFPIDEIQTKNVHTNKDEFPVGLLTLPYQENASIVYLVLLSLPCIEYNHMLNTMHHMS